MFRDFCRNRRSWLRCNVWVSMERLKCIKLTENTLIFRNGKVIKSISTQFDQRTKTIRLIRGARGNSFFWIDWITGKDETNKSQELLPTIRTPFDWRTSTRETTTQSATWTALSSLDWIGSHRQLGGLLFCFVVFFVFCVFCLLLVHFACGPTRTSSFRVRQTVRLWALNSAQCLHSSLRFQVRWTDRRSHCFCLSTIVTCNWIPRARLIACLVRTRGLKVKLRNR